MSRSCRPRSASVTPEIDSYLIAHGLSLTDALNDWYASEIGQAESSRLKDKLAEIDAGIKTLPVEREKVLKQIEIARAREARIAAERARRDARKAEGRRGR